MLPDTSQNACKQFRHLRSALGNEQDTQIRLQFELEVIPRLESLQQKIAKIEKGKITFTFLGLRANGLIQFVEKRRRMRPEDFSKPDKCPSCEEMDSVKHKLKPCNGKCGRWICRTCLGWAVSGSRARIWCCYDCLGLEMSKDAVRIHHINLSSEGFICQYEMQVSQDNSIAESDSLLSVMSEKDIESLLEETLNSAGELELESRSVDMS